MFTRNFTRSFGMHVTIRTSKVIFYSVKVYTLLKNLQGYHFWGGGEAVYIPNFIRIASFIEFYTNNIWSLSSGHSVI